MIAIQQDSSPQQTIQAHVVEEIIPEQLADVTDVNKVISQLLPTRKRKPRTKKPNTNGENMHFSSFKLSESLKKSILKLQQKYLELMDRQRQSIRQWKMATNNRQRNHHALRIQIVSFITVCFSDDKIHGYFYTSF